MANDFRYGVYGVDLPPHPIDDEEVRQCRDTTTLLAIIYPTVESLADRYIDLEATYKNRMSYKNELNQLEQYLHHFSIFPLSHIQEIVMSAARIAEIAVTSPRINMRRVFCDFENHTPRPTR